jgi:hypothetical protein
VNELIGFVCRCEFRMDSTKWPIHGHPAWVVVEAVDMPMVKMRDKFGGAGLWVNAADIASISSTGERAAL